jgi:hypothetical protein
LTQCLSKCLATETCKDDGHAIHFRWLCDGENDCVDGSDERDCKYLACEDGSLVGADRQCDDYPDCSDGSDEAQCL